MITPTQIYWLTRLDGLVGFLSILIAVTLLVAFINGLICVAYWGDEDCARLKRRVVRLSVLATIVALLMSFIPDTKQMAAILIVPRIANREKVQTVGNRLYDLAVEWMDELKPRKGEAK